MSDKNKIREAIRGMADDTICYSVVCTVVSVTGDLCECSPVNGDANYLDVKLQAQATTGLLIKPVVGSVVVVSLIDKNSGFISMFSEVDTIELKGNNYKGLVRVVDLTTKLNNLENKVNAIIAAYNAHVHVETGASTAATVTLVAGTLTPTTQTEIENTKILHGNG